jgi:hypothetical protein
MEVAAGEVGVIYVKPATTGATALGVAAYRRHADSDAPPYRNGARYPEWSASMRAASEYRFVRDGQCPKNRTECRGHSDITGTRETSLTWTYWTVEPCSLFPVPLHTSGRRFDTVRAQSCYCRFTRFLHLRSRSGQPPIGRQSANGIGLNCKDSFVQGVERPDRALLDCLLTTTR